MTESQKAKIIKLRADGNGCRAIASKLGMSVNTVKSFCKRNNINSETAAVCLHRTGPGRVPETLPGAGTAVRCGERTARYD